MKWIEDRSERLRLAPSALPWAHCDAENLSRAKKCKAQKEKDFLKKRLWKRLWHTVWKAVWKTERDDSSTLRLFHLFEVNWVPLHVSWSHFRLVRTSPCESLGHPKDLVNLEPLWVEVKPSGRTFREVVQVFQVFQKIKWLDVASRKGSVYSNIYYLT